MSIKLHDNIIIKAGKPLDSKYLSSGNTAYASVNAVNLAIPISERHLGLTVNIGNVEYWYKNGVTNSDLIEKLVTVSDYVSGATNIGYFAGNSGLQTLGISYPSQPSFTGNYISMYNYYYRGTDGIIHVGTPSDGIQKRGYLKSILPVKTWIWNEYVGGADAVGWLFIDGDASTSIGTFKNSSIPQYYNKVTTFPYVQTTWVNGFYNNSSLATVNATGSLSTGNTISIGARPYGYKEDRVLHFKTLISKTPSLITVTDDEAFMYVSGKTAQVLGENVGTVGVGVYAGLNGTNLKFRKIVGSGNTTVYQNGDNVVVYSIDTGGEGEYNLDSPSSVSVGGIVSGTTLIGKTSFELFEDLLVPTLYPTLTNPSSSISISPSGIIETGTIIGSLSITGNFDAGSINPQYTAACDKRSNGALSYCFVGSHINNNFGDLTNSHTEYLNNYTVCSGVQSWQVKNNYKSGVQPYDSKTNYYCTPLSAGTTSFSASATITGILPWYWGLSTSPVVNGTCIATCGRGSGTGGKCLENVTSAPIQIEFNSTADDYIWFALPTCAANKTNWYYEGGGNSGTIGGVGDLFKPSDTVSVTSFEGYWSGCSYNVYVSNYKTVTAASVKMNIY